MSEAVAPAAVHVVGYLDGHSGYTVHTLAFAQALARLRPVVATSLSGVAPAEQAALVARRADLPVHVAILYGDMMGVLAGCRGLRIGYTVWESTRLPDGWIEALAPLDEVWTPSAWGRDVMIAEGLPAARVRVVPEGVDPEIFHPGPPAESPFPPSEEFRFLHVGRYEPRKGTLEVVRAFDGAFGGSDAPVRLVLACDNPHVPGDKVKGAIARLRLRRPDRLTFVEPVARHATFAELYRCCHAYVGASRAEGWGLPLLEAMACGLPVISPTHGGQSAFLDATTGWPVAYRLEPVSLPYFRRADGDYGVWAAVDLGDLAAQMRRVHGEREAARAKGLAAAAVARERWSWDRAAAIADGAIRALTGGAG